MKPISERTGVDAESFRGEIKPANRPVVLRGAAAHWPAVAAARRGPRDLLAYLGRFDAGRAVDVLIGAPEIEGYLFYRDDMSGLNFARSKQRIAAVLGELIRLEGAARPPAVALQSVEVRDWLPGFEAENALPHVDAAVSPRVWIGNKVTVAPHFDLNDNVAVVVAGRRRFTLFPPDQLPNLYVGPFDFSPAGAPVSMVDPRAPDFDRYPRYREALAAAETAELEPGDAIYIPYMWWHGVESLGAFNMLVNYWWNEARPAGSPFDVLMHALLVMRPMAPEQKAVWRAMLDHYVFGANGDPLEHLAPEHRGILAEPNAELRERMKQFLLGQIGKH